MIYEHYDNIMKMLLLELIKCHDLHWFAVYGVTQSQTQLKQLSSSMERKTLRTKLRDGTQ